MLCQPVPDALILRGFEGILSLKKTDDGLLFSVLRSKGEKENAAGPDGSGQFRWGWFQKRRAGRGDPRNLFQPYLPGSVV